MNEVDFDETTLETKYAPIGVIGARKHYEKINKFYFPKWTIAEVEALIDIEQISVWQNTILIKRKYFDKMSNLQIEAYFTKFDQVLINDSENPYVKNRKTWLFPLTKKEKGVKVGKIIAKGINRKNIRKGINGIQQGMDLISDITDEISLNPPPKKSKRGKKRKSDKPSFF